MRVCEMNIFSRCGLVQNFHRWSFRVEDTEVHSYCNSQRAVMLQDSRAECFSAITLEQAEQLLLRSFYRQRVFEVLTLLHFFFPSAYICARKMLPRRHCGHWRPFHTVLKRKSKQQSKW